ncbi:hypothetical protein QBC37DRAFT_112007 [Rhypophila decipiens]|uniref:Malate dehydrogenase n=1 Tax=Rhypophila decipiens TaxID=261697 RepID=A0AAN7BDW2_9PEZI|nr:hypothetical protein QBC37DRAFT_112007 [Rhypophila decipiens]
MVSAKIFALAAMASGVFAAPKCRPSPTVPVAGATSNLSSPPPNAVLKKIAIGHGLQNYTCASPSQPSAQAAGALAVLYDVTPLYPGKAHGLERADFDALPITTLYSQDLPLNMTQSGPNVYAANAGSPWIAPADLTLGERTIKFLGHHYFDIDSIPMFDLQAAGLKASVVRNDSVAAPLNADKGPMGTGAVAWLQLKDSGKGKSVGIDYVYRVITAGGNPVSCSTGASSFSIPYTTFYWFYKFY